MRTIKFRAWDKKNKKMINWHDLLQNPDGAFIGLFNGYLDAMVLLQFTGLKDRNKKEIYESDILKVVGGMKGEIGVVEWATLGWRINWDYAKNLGKLDYSLTCDSALEVIGNIYENPELLKEKDGKEEKWNENVETCPSCGIEWKKIGKQCKVCYVL